jgi:CubicO group peptidase (beta-lactamase class C family)
MKADYLKVFEETVEAFKKTYQAQGLIVGIFDKESILYQRSFGYRDVEKKLPIDGDTIFGIASITKSFTVVRLMQLFEQGVIDIDLPVSAFYSDWKLPSEHTPTVKQLMSHLGGFYPQERFLMQNLAKDLDISDEELSRSEDLSREGIRMIINRLNSLTSFNGKPGQRFSYSNFSFGILTDLVERYSKESTYSESVINHLVQPMGLRRTFFDFTRPAREENVTCLYTPSEEGVKCSNDFTDLGFVLLGGGALKSTFNDLVTYTRMYLNKGVQNKRIISQESFKEMTKERTSYKAHQGYGYALVTGDLEGIEYAGHSGGLTGVSSFFGFTESSERGVVVLCNTGGVPATAIGIAALRLANDTYPAYRIGTYEDSSWSKDLLSKTLGRYESDEGDRVDLKLIEGKIYGFVNGTKLPCRTVDDDILLLENKMEESYCKIIRGDDQQAFGLYLGSRILPFVGLTE